MAPPPLHSSSLLIKERAAQRRRRRHGEGDTEKALINSHTHAHITAVLLCWLQVEVEEGRQGDAEASKCGAVYEEEIWETYASWTH